MRETYRSSQSSNTTTQMTKNASFFFCCNQKNTTKNTNDYTNDFWETCTFHQLPSPKSKKNHHQLPSHPAVQVVGRLIQQQNVAISHHCLGAPNGSWKPSSTSPSLNGECQVAEASSNFMRQPPLSSFTCKMLMQRPQVPRNVVKESVCVWGVSDVLLCLSLQNVSPNLDKQSPQNEKKKSHPQKN